MIHSQFHSQLAGWWGWMMKKNVLVLGAHPSRWHDLSVMQGILYEQLECLRSACVQMQCTLNAGGCNSDASFVMAAARTAQCAPPGSTLAGC